MPTPRLVVVTGASGFIGRPLVRALVAEGCRVRALVRSPERLAASLGATLDRIEPFAWQLGETPPAAAFAGPPDALIHLAVATRGSSATLLDTNVGGTRLLLDAVPPTTFRVFISSFSAGPAADAGLAGVSAYSAGKRRVEEMFDPARDLILRPGLVVGPGEDGLFARMRMQLERGMPIPLFYRGLTPVQWIHVDELVRAIVDGMLNRTTGLFPLASSETVTLDEWTRKVAQSLGIEARMFRVPDSVSDLTARLLRLAERTGARLPISSDTVFGIKYAQPVDTRAALSQLRASVAGLDQTLARVRS